jgi:hypothetical protein
MAGDGGSSFPFTALSVVVLFLSSTYLAQQGFELWRQPDSDAGKRMELSQPPVEARLWEDPLGALSRHRQKLKELCKTEDTVAAKSGTGTTPGSTEESTETLTAVACRDGQALKAETFKKELDATRGVTLIAAMLPGAALVGAEELRRRARYAVLSGLNAAGYVPTDSERMGLVSVKRCEKLGGCGQNTAKVDIAYEKLTAKSGNGRQVVVLWIDDGAIGRRWLTATTIALKELTPDGRDVRLSIVGPARSDELVRALGEDLTAVEADAEAGGPDLTGNWAALRTIRLFSPLSTAPAAQVIPAARLGAANCSELTIQKQFTQRQQAAVQEEPLPNDCIAEAFKRRLEKIAGLRPGLERPNPGSPFFVRTIGTDDLLIDRLTEELRGRGVEPCASDNNTRIVLVSEWDSIYARTFADTLRDQLQCTGRQLQTYSYLRGLDGATLEGISTQTRRGENARGSDKGAPVEWPEGRAQADYVRRLVEEIRKENDKYPVQAVGMIGSDVHDKLVLMQALRDAFPDRMLFTTDVDSRLSHPSMTRYTRNVIVASSLPLIFDETIDVSWNSIGPFRDVYQTATFLAARLAVRECSGETGTEGRACRSAEPKEINAVDAMPNCGERKNNEELACRIQAAVSVPQLFEIGRDRMVELPRTGITEPDQDKRGAAAAASFALLLMLGGLMVVGHPGPAMKHAWKSWSMAGQRPVNEAHTIIAAVQVAALGFAAGVVLELAVPGGAGAFGPLLLAVTAAALFGTIVFPGKPWAQGLRPAVASVGTGIARQRWAWLRLAAVAAVIAGYFIVLRLAGPQMHEPFAPLSGVSAWPAELLRTFAVVLFAWFLDETWNRSIEATRRIGKEYRLVRTMPALTRQKGRVARLLNSALWFRQPETALSGRRVDGAKLWNHYRRLMENGPRCTRFVAWLVVSAVIIFLVIVVVNALTDSPLPELPARGRGDRALFWMTLGLSSLGVVVLLVLVGDATVTTMWFVDRLKDGRTVYPPETVARFADELGPELREQACELIAAYPEQRGKLWDGPDGAACTNTILDDWIDARLLAEHTAAIGRLIIFPFIILALMVVARSRLFDNWEIGGSVLAILLMYLLWSIALAAMMNFSAEQARRKAVSGMEADLRWMKGAGKAYEGLAGTFEDLLQDVRTLRRGAFAPFFEQPLVQAILVPLGGAGGVQLLDWLLYARAQ